jgi:hypothetical protein
VILSVKTVEVVSKPQIASKNKAWLDEKAQHTWAYVSISRRTTTPLLGVRWGFETTSKHRLDSGQILSVDSIPFVCNAADGFDHISHAYVVL